MKRLIGVILSIAMLISMAVVPVSGMAASGSADIVLTRNTGDSIVPPGTKVTISAQITGAEDAASLKFYEMGTLVSTITDLTGDLTYKATAATGSKSVYAQLVDSEGNAIATSDTVLVTGYKEVVDDLMWDIDFEDEYFHTIADYPEYRYLYGADGAALSQTRYGAKSTLTAHTGITSNDMTIESSGDATHGKAVKLTTKAVNQNQFNEFHARNGGILVGQWDYRFTVVPPSQDYLTVAMFEPNIAPDLTGKSEILAPTISMKYRGETPYICWTDGVDNEINDIYWGVAEAGVWYNLKTYTDFNSGVIKYYINNEFVTAYSFDNTAYSCMEKYRTSLYYAKGAEVWVDNFRVERVTLTDVTPSVTITDGSGGRALTAGSKVRLGLNVANGDDFVSYKLFSSTDGVNYTEALEANGADGYVLATVSEYPTSHIVKACDANGNVLAVSNTITVAGGKKANVKTSIWDLDFEDENLAITASGTSRYLTQNGTEIKNTNGDGMKLTVGDDDDTIEIGNSSAITGASNGNSLIFTINGSGGAAKMHDVYAKVPNGKAVYSYDVATTTLANGKAFLGGAAANKTWFPVIETGETGDLYLYVRSANPYLSAGVTPVTSGTYTGYKYICKYETNTWYNIKLVMDVEAGDMDIYFNDVYIATEVARISTTNYPERFEVTNGSTAGSLYVDNIQAYTITYDTPESGIDSVDYAINNEKAENISAGALQVTANITNDGTACSRICYVAVYDDDNTLVRIYATPVTFAEGETHRKVYVDAGSVSADMVVRTMLWNSDGITPVSSASELK